MPIRTIISDLPESISKNIFEEYIRLIDHLRNNLSRRKKNAGEISLSLDFLDKIILGIERNIQDLNAFKKHIYNFQAIQLSNAVIKLLRSWINVLASYDNEIDDELDNLDSLNYILLVALSVVSKYKLEDSNDLVRHLSKLTLKDSQPPSAELEISGYLHNAVSQFLQSQYGETLVFTDRGLRLPELEELNLTNVHRSLANELSKKGYFKKKEADPTELSDNEKYYYSQFYEYINNFFHTDYFGIKEFSHLKNIEEVSDLQETLKTYDFHEKLERLFEFNEDTTNAVWDVNIRFDASNYNASQIAYLLWTFSKGLEAIDGIEVELIEWGEGSKTVRLKIKIKNNAAKVDLKQVLKITHENLSDKLQPSREPNYDEKGDPYIKNEDFDPRPKAREREREKEKETLRKLEIKKRELELEEKKIEVGLKKLAFLRGISEILVDGIIQNDSNIQMFINETLFFSKEYNSVSYGDPNLLDSGESYEQKDISDAEKNSMKD